MSESMKVLFEFVRCVEICGIVRKMGILIIAISTHNTYIPNNQNLLFPSHQNYLHIIIFFIKYEET